MRVLNAPAKWLTVTTCVTLLACGDTTAPGEVEFQVIEDLEFAAILGVDLSAMELHETGVYIQDLTAGEGDPVTWGDEVWLGYEGWLYDGTRFDAGEIDFILGSGQVIPGFDQGILGMRLGGQRRMVIPPALAYGTQGAGSVPPGSVLVFEVEVLNVVR